MKVVNWKGAIKGMSAKGFRKTKNGRYEAFISNHSKSISLGTYDTSEDVKEAVFNYRIKRFVDSVKKYGLNPDNGVVYEDKYIVFDSGK